MNRNPCSMAFLGALRRISSVSLPLVCGGLLLVCAPALAWQEEQIQEEDAKNKNDAAQIENEGAPNGAQTEEESAGPQTGSNHEENWLGAMILNTPDGVAGVRVAGVDPISPAAEAGLRAGDFVLSFNGEKVTSARQLADQVKAIGEDARPEMVVWRDGGRMTLTVDFASARQFRSPRDLEAQEEAREETRDQAAWLGAVLNEQISGEPPSGALIDRVFPGGPAARGGLRPGDVVTRVGDAEVTSANQLIEAIKQSQPGDTVTIAVMRNGQPGEHQVTLGSRRDFTNPAFGPSGRNPDFRGPFGGVPGQGMLEQQRQFAEKHQRIEEKLDRVLEELEQLRSRLDKLDQE